MGSAASASASASASSRKSSQNNLLMDRRNCYSRKAHHAGSWYSDSKADLDAMLSNFLQAVGSDSSTVATNSLRAVICPHAGYSYSGPTAAYSYDAVAKELSKPSSPIRRILVLHPSHHVYLPTCTVSGASVLETPLGNLPVDAELRDEILNLSSSKTPFSIMEQHVDEREHSGEMQYPYLQKSLSCRSIPVLPVMCGSLSTEQEKAYGNILAPIIARPDVLCVISSDFCHWGSRFSYQPTGGRTDSRTIFEYIREMDHQGMRHIEMKEPGAFAMYLKQTKNTICGRHPISVWLNAITVHSQGNVLDVSFVRYAQSSEVRSMRDSSVSYASAIATQRST